MDSAGQNRPTNVDVELRNAAVAELVRRVRGKQATTVLDVGGVGGMGRAMPTSAVLSVNTDQAGASGVLEVSTGHLPFPDRSWDVVVAVDVLEHEPAEQRPRLVAECARIARDLVVICGPWQTPQALWVEERIEQLNRDICGRPNEWLAEHRRFGRPTAKDFAHQPGYEHYLTLGVNPAQIVRESYVVSTLAAEHWGRPAVRAATQKLLTSFHPLEQYGLPYRTAWLARRSPLPPAEQLVERRPGTTERLVDCMPEIIGALDDVTATLALEHGRLLGRSSGEDRTNEYLATMQQHVPELQAELQRLRTLAGTPAAIAAQREQVANQQAELAALRIERDALRSALAAALR